MDLGLAGRAVVVTGGSRGIGLETARLFAREGARVLICARRESALAEAAADIHRTTGHAVVTHSLDVTSVEQIAALPDVIGRMLGGIDVLVNNAGTGTYKPFLEVSDEELVYGMAINFFAQFRICQRVVPMMIARGGGRIVNVSGETGIKVTDPPFLSSCTGPALTPERFAKWEREMAKRPLSEEEAERVRHAWSANQGMRATRWGTPEELANMIVFTASDAASYVNGAVLVADGAQDKS